MPITIDIVGLKFNKLTVVERLPNSKARCKCDCGNEKICAVRDLRRGQVKGCGCQRNLPAQRKICKGVMNRLREEGKVNTGHDVTDYLTPFRYTLKCINLQERKKHHGQLTLSDLKDIWEKQKGICTYSKVKLILPTYANYNISGNFRASLDRIDSSKPYEKGNVHFISATCNFAKNKMTHEEMIQFLNIIKSS